MLSRSYAAGNIRDNGDSVARNMSWLLSPGINNLTRKLWTGCQHTEKQHWFCSCSDEYTQMWSNLQGINTVDSLNCNFEHVKFNTSNNEMNYTNLNLEMKIVDTYLYNWSTFDRQTNAFHPSLQYIVLTRLPYICNLPIPDARLNKASGYTRSYMRPALFIIATSWLCPLLCPSMAIHNLSGVSGWNCSCCYDTYVMFVCFCHSARGPNYSGTFSRALSESNFTPPSLHFRYQLFQIYNMILLWYY